MELVEVFLVKSYKIEIDSNSYTFTEEQVKELINKLQSALSNSENYLSIKPGDILWFETLKDNGFKSLGVQPHKVKDIYTTYRVESDDIFGYCDIKDWCIGKQVFTTKEEAEKYVNEKRSKN